MHAYPLTWAAPSAPFTNIDMPLKVVFEPSQSGRPLERRKE
jgi:hypothetical protein